MSMPRASRAAFLRHARVWRPLPQRMDIQEMTQIGVSLIASRAIVALDRL
jgi:hypothetical protein